ncbi:MAG: hypothetical protein R3A78_14780 [Polyangiales bacterium]
MVPDDAIAVVHVDLARLRASKHYGHIAPLLERASAENPAMSRVLAASSEALFAIHSHSTAKHDTTGALLLRGKFTDKDLADFHAERAKREGDPSSATPFEDGGVRGWAWKDGTRSYLLGDHTWVTVDETWFARLNLAAMHPDGKEPLEAVRQGFPYGGHVADFAADVEALDRSTLDAAREQAVGPLRDVAETKRLVGYVELGSDLDANIRFEMRDAATATHLAKEVVNARDLYGRNLVIRAMGFADAIAGISATSDGSSATLRLQLKQATVSMLFDRLSQILARFAEHVGAQMGTSGDGT